MANRVVIPSHGIDVGLQIFWMQNRFPGFCYSRKKGWMGWTGSIQPTELSPNYRIKIQYRGPQSPKVHVMEPSIHPKAPHKYGDDSLCLFYPPDRSWEKQTIIAKTIIPWTAEWLIFYECWLETGNWLGNEAPHKGPKASD